MCGDCCPHQGCIASRTVAEGSNGVADRGAGGGAAGAGSVAETTTARTSDGTRRWVPVRGCQARNEESGTGMTA